MINRQSILFLTLFSLILVISVYYITIPDDSFKQADDENILDEPVITVQESEYITALKIEYERENIELLDEYFATPVGWTIEGMSRDPRLDPIRDHPGWLALVEKYKRTGTVD